MDPKIESKSSYDDRRKVLTHLTTETREAKLGEDVIGELLITSKGVYNESGIRKILGDLKTKKKVIENNIVTLKELQDPVPDLKRDTELERLKENLKILQLKDHKEKASEADIKKEAENLKNNEEDLKKVNKNIKDIQDAIGTRLKL